MMGSIAFNFEVVSYKMLLDLFNIYPTLSRDVATPMLWEFLPIVRVYYRRSNKFF